MALKDELHPLHGYKIRGLQIPSQEANTAFIDAIQKGLTTGEQQMYQARLEAFLDTSEGEWLDYWGQWLGLHREGRNDDIYRNALKQHVLHKRNTITSIRETLATYLKTNIENIYIYEPWRDMFVYNSSKWNTYKFYPSTYYRYAVIDVQIDAPFNQSIAKLINLFRPAGVYWVITSLVNVLSRKAPIVDFTIDTRYHFISDDIDYVGFLQRHNNSITPDYFFNLSINNPFIYNKSLFNGGRVYYQAQNDNQGVASIAPMYHSDTVPKDEDTRETAFSYIQPLKYGDTTLLSKVDGHGVDYPFKAVNSNLMTGVTKENNSNTYHLIADWINYHAKTNDNLFIYGQRAVQTYTSEIRKYKIRLPKGDYTFSVNTEQVTFPFKIYVHILQDAVNSDTDLSSETFPANQKQKFSVSFSLKNNATVELSPIYTSDVNTMGEYKYSQVQLQQGKFATEDIVYQTPKAYLLGVHTQNDSEVNLHAMNDKTGLMSFYMDQENQENFDTKGRNWHIYRIPQDCVPTDFTFDSDQPVLNATLVPYNEQTTLNPMPYLEENLKPAPLMGFIDFYDYYQQGQLTGANKRYAVLNEIDDSKIKNLTIYMKDNMGSEQDITAYAYDFMVNRWIELATFSINGNYQVFKLSFITLQNYLNNNGLLFVKLVPSRYDQNLAIDYFGFSYGHNEVSIFSYNIEQTGYGWETEDTNGTVNYPRVGVAKVDQAKLVMNPQAMSTIFLQHQLTDNSNNTQTNLVSGDVLVISADQAEPGNNFTYPGVYVGDLQSHVPVIVNVNQNTNGEFTVNKDKIRDLSIVLITSHINQLGVNLLDGTNDFSFPYTLTHANDSGIDEDSHAIYVSESASSTNPISLTFTVGGQATDTLDSTRDFAMSVELRGTGTLTQFGFTSAEKDSKTNIELNTNYWQTYEFASKKKDNSGHFILAFSSNNNQDVFVGIRHIKVEYGETSTPYSGTGNENQIREPQVAGQVTVTAQMIDADDGNKILRTDNRHGFAGDTIKFDFNSWLLPNMHWQTQPGNSYTVPTSDSVIKVYVEHDKQIMKNFIMNTVTRTVNITEPGQQLKTTTDKFVFTRDGIKDKYTNKSSLSDWNVPSYHFDAITIPGVEGYTPQVTGNAGAIDVTPSTLPWTVNITYTKN